MGRDRKFTILVLAFFLAFGIFTSAVFLESQGTQTRATNECTPVVEKSFILSVPKTVPAGEACQVTVVARCEDESVVTGAQVNINVTGGTATPSELLTDQDGKALFAVTGPELAQINATINGSLNLPQTVTCAFE